MDARTDKDYIFNDKIIFMCSVALRKNERTIVSGISDTGGHNPVFQSTLLPLLVGDVVQLQVFLKHQLFQHKSSSYLLLYSVVVYVV